MEFLAQMDVSGNVLTDALPPQLSPADLSGAKTGRLRGTGAPLLFGGAGNWTHTGPRVQLL